MILILWLLGILIVALTVRQLLKSAPTNGKPFLLRVVVILVLLVAAAMAMRGLWPVAMSLLGGLMVYGRPVLQAFGLWRQLQSMQQKQQQSAPSTNNDTMDVATARQILELEENPNKEDILAAHKRMMAKNHPDKGGSTYLASQINQAKDLLLAALEN
jgi:predicted membrane chloride channel (bestrophin family)